jgi:Tol biopolymer transport system component
MNEPMDRALADWLRDGPDDGPREVLDRALATTRSVSQRPGWAIPERWLPMQLTIQRIPSMRPVFYLALVALLVAALVAAAILVGSPRRLPEPFGPAGNGLVAYDAGGTLFLSDPDLGSPRQIEGGLGAILSPVFSRDGRQIAFWSATSPNAFARHLFVQGVDDPGPARKLSGSHPSIQGHVTAPAWSIDGSRLVYAASTADGVRLASAAVDGSGIRFLTDAPEVKPWTPVASPDGRWLAFRSRAPQADLLVMPFDGGNPRILLTVDEPTDAFVNLAWSLDSTRVVFHRPDPQGGPAVVETIDIRDRSIVRVSRPLGHNTDPSWSPDGRWITYGLEIDGEHHQVIVAPDGSGYRDLGMVGGCVMGWSPDSKYLFGFTTECFSSKITRIPIDDPSAAVVRDLPGNLTGMPDWQRVAP